MPQDYMRQVFFKCTECQYIFTAILDLEPIFCPYCGVGDRIEDIIPPGKQIEWEVPAKWYPVKWRSKE